MHQLDVWEQGHNRAAAVLSKDAYHGQEASQHTLASPQCTAHRLACNRAQEQDLVRTPLPARSFVQEAAVGTCGMHASLPCWGLSEASDA